MPCGCSKGNSVSAAGGAELVYIFTDPDTGRQFTYRTKYEAEYANMRVGNRGNVRQEVKT